MLEAALSRKSAAAPRLNSGLAVVQDMPIDGYEWRRVSA